MTVMHTVDLAPVKKQPLTVSILLSNGEAVQYLTRTYTYCWSDPDGISRSITVPKGYLSDGASVPRLVWTLSGIIPDGLIRAAALIHDFIYDHSGQLPFGSYRRIRNGNWEFCSNEKWTRKVADKLFGRINRECGVPKFQRRVAYLAVRAGGWIGW